MRKPLAHFKYGVIYATKASMRCRDVQHCANYFLPQRHAELCAPIAFNSIVKEKVMRVTCVISALFLVGLVGCNTMAGPGPNDIPASIAKASTPTDHQKIADYFARKAVEYDAEAAQHDLMARSYITRPKGEVGSMISHCRALRDQFISAAKTARTLAQEHQQMAVKGG